MKLFLVPSFFPYFKNTAWARFVSGEGSPCRRSEGERGKGGVAGEGAPGSGVAPFPTTRPTKLLRFEGGSCRQKRGMVELGQQCFFPRLRACRVWLLWLGYYYCRQVHPSLPVSSRGRPDRENIKEQKDIGTKGPENSPPMRLHSPS